MSYDFQRTVDLIAEIYDAIGDAERWRRLSERLAARALPLEIQSHVDVARRAHEEQRRLTGEIEVLKGVHDTLALGVLVVCADGRVLAANASAQQMLTDSDGLILSRGRLGAAIASDDAALHEAIERRAAGINESSPSNPFLLVSRPGRPPLSVVVRPTDSRLHFFEERGSVLLLAIDPDRECAPSTESLRELFGLTAREAELAALLATGKSVGEAASALGVTVNTARTFLARVTSKMDSHSQAELVRRLLAIPH